MRTKKIPCCSIAEHFFTAPALALAFALFEMKQGFLCWQSLLRMRVRNVLFSDSTTRGVGRRFKSDPAWKDWSLVSSGPAKTISELTKVSSVAGEPLRERHPRSIRDFHIRPRRRIHGHSQGRISIDGARQPEGHGTYRDSNLALIRHVCRATPRQFSLDIRHTAFCPPMRRGWPPWRTDSILQSTKTS